MTETVGKEIHLKKRPVGMPQLDDFEVVEVSVPQPGPGEVLVRNIYMSVDPYMRGRMADRKSYAQSFRLDEPMTGGCVGQVVRSNHDNYAVGAYVLAFQGWRQLYVSTGQDLTPIDPTLAPIQSFLGAMGMPGLTAYVGLLDIGQAKEGDTVFVSGAAGAVGSVVCPIARIVGCRVVGSAGSQIKLDWLLNEAHIDAAFNYKEVPDLVEELGKHCPDGIDIYFDNVGGDHLKAALTHMNTFGRIPLCGMISQYNATEAVPGPSNLGVAVGKRLTLQGFIVSDHADRRAQFYEDMNKWISANQIRWEETIVEGIENAPLAFIGLFKGENLGKMVVKVGPDPAA